MTPEQTEEVKTLILPVKRKWFDQIKEGSKKGDHRKATAYWRKRLVDKYYDIVVVTLGYPKKDDKERRQEFKYCGWFEEEITHEEFQNEPTLVYTIPLLTRIWNKRA